MGNFLWHTWKRAWKPDHHARRKLRLHLFGILRALAVALCCALGLLAAGKLNFAVAVNLDGDTIGYVSSREELDAIVEDVQHSVSDALGYDWSAPELTTWVTLGESTQLEGDADAMAGRLYDTAEQVELLQLVYVDGEAVCAFRTAEEATEALENLAAGCVTEDAESARFLETVSVSGGMADLRLLDGNLEALEEAITVEVTRRVTVEETVDFETKLLKNTEMFADESYVLVSGIPGQLTTEYLVTLQDGVVTEYTSISSQLTKPVSEVLVIGTRTRHSTGSYIWPVEEAYVTSDFGYRVSIGSSYHQGVDLANDAGTPIHAADGGVVLFSGEYKGYGLIIKIQHDNGDVTYYAHCKKLLVSAGEVVAQGDEIALMGSTGVSSGSHLHFELHPGGGSAVDPMDYLPDCPFEYLDC